MYFNFEELAWPHKASAVHPIPIRLDIHHYESLSPTINYQYLPSGFHRVGVDGHYIIGVIIYEKLWPFMSRRADLNNNYGRVKLRMNGNNANEAVPILNNDPLNYLFYERFAPNKIRRAEVILPHYFNIGV